LITTTDDISWRDLFEPQEIGTTFVLTVGNLFRSDDGVGPFIAKHVPHPRGHIRILDAGDKPENCIDRATELKPVRSVIIDAADFGGRPGEIRLIPEEAIPDTMLSTHTFPLRIIAKILAEDTGSPVFFLGIQPKTMDFGEGLSPEIRSAADEIVRMLSAKIQL